MPAKLRVNCRIVAGGDLIRNVELSFFCCLTHFTHLVKLYVINVLSFVFHMFLVVIVFSCVTFLFLLSSLVFP